MVRNIHIKALLCVGVSFLILDVYGASSSIKGLGGRSVQDLIESKRLPKVRTNFSGQSELVLADKGLTGLNGIENIPGKERIESLILYGNNIATISKDAFAGFDNLKAINLQMNKIASIDAGAFKALENLKQINLNGNDSLSESIINELKSSLPGVEIIFDKQYESDLAGSLGYQYSDSDSDEAW